MRSLRKKANFVILTKEDQMSLLDEPVTEKIRLGKRWFGYCAMQGWRPHMEDRHQHLRHLDEQRWRHWAYFAIFDGHSGSGTAENASESLHRYLLETFDELIKRNSSTKIPSNLIRRAIKRSFVKLDRHLRTIDEDHSGCVCVAALINQRKIFLINVGDARGILISDEGQVLASTHDHKPDDPVEQQRIFEAGGTITKKPSQHILRVERRLAMTRVLGDFSLNKNVVPPIPDIVIYPRKSSASMIILGSDGIWDVMTNDEIAQFVSERVKTTTLKKIASQLLDHCLAKNSRDTMSVYIVKV